MGGGEGGLAEALAPPPPPPPNFLLLQFLSSSSMYTYFLKVGQVERGISEREEAVVDLGGVRGVQMHPPLAASNVFLRT